jgi:hypothetical protein
VERRAKLWGVLAGTKSDGARRWCRHVRRGEHKNSCLLSSVLAFLSFPLSESFPRFVQWGVAESDDDLSAGNSTNTTQGCVLNLTFRIVSWTHRAITWIDAVCSRREDTGSPSAAEASVATEADNILAGSAAAGGASGGLDDDSE